MFELDAVLFFLVADDAHIKHLTVFVIIDVPPVSHSVDSQDRKTKQDEVERGGYKRRLYFESATSRQDRRDHNEDKQTVRVSLTTSRVSCSNFM